MLAASSELDDLDEYRARADRFLAELEDEHYRHLAGLKPTLELEAIYERFADITSLDACSELEAGPPELRRLACEEYLAGAARGQIEAIARLEAALTTTVDGAELSYRMLPPG